MPAGVSWPTYLKMFAASLLAMCAGAEVVHRYYRPDLMAAVAGAMPVRSQEPGASSWSPMRVQSPSSWAILHCPPRPHQRAGLEEEQPGLQPSAHVGCWCRRQYLKSHRSVENSERSFWV
nr:uncharacterized protein LOC100342621 isoform X5 [Oryctolagus cuniculus]